MKRLRAILVLCVVTALVYCSCGMLLSGAPGSGQETTNGIVAVVRHQDGAPASGAVVRLRRSDYVKPVPSSALLPAGSADAVTDPAGRFAFYGISPGGYCVEVSTNSSTVLFTCSIGSVDTVDLGTDSLRPFAALTGTIDSLKGSAFARIQGLERLAPIDNGGHFAFTDLPQGNFDVRIDRTGAPSAALEIANVRTMAGDTATVFTDATRRFSRRLYLNTTRTGAAVMTDVIGFPLLVRLSGADFDFSQARDSGQDIRFFSPGGAKLPYEIDTWDRQNQAAAIWVRVDTVLGNSDSRFVTMAWGNSAAAGGSDGGSVFDTTGGFVGVWHLGESRTGTYRDATANGLHGLAGGADSVPARAAGTIGNGQAFNGKSSYIFIPDNPALHLATAFTVSFWAFYQSDTSINVRFISKDGDWSIKESGDRPQITMADSAYLLADAPLAQGRWYFIAAVVDNLDGPASAQLYVDGNAVQPYENTFPAWYLPGDRIMNDRLCFGQQGNNDFFFKGVLDEVQINRKALTADEIRLMYENQRPGSAVVTAGPF
jgi:hypothetical protein